MPDFVVSWASAIVANLPVAAVVSLALTLLWRSMDRQRVVWALFDGTVDGSGTVWARVLNVGDGVATGVRVASSDGDPILTIKTGEKTNEGKTVMPAVRSGDEIGLWLEDAKSASGLTVQIRWSQPPFAVWAGQRNIFGVPRRTTFRASASGQTLEFERCRSWGNL